MFTRLRNSKETLKTQGELEDKNQLLPYTGKGLTSWLSLVVSSCEFLLYHWYPGSGVVIDCIDS